ncbi:85/88 kDa calcium-independent phospholipase A2-like [Sarcoptes scabiei]|nr:85/88 kDa calcium-independent phospholipase A2-like [Sarcoptes scabiei]
MVTDRKRNQSKVFVEQIDDHIKKRKLSTKYESDNGKSFKLMTASNIKRPQIVYKIKIDNSYSTPFIPRLSFKPNALIPLEESIKPIKYDPPLQLNPSFGKEIKCPSHYYPHPYQNEIENFETPKEFFTEPDPNNLKFSGFEENKFLFIDRRQDLFDLIESLKNYKEIAVDLEHHSFRSYEGLTCLLQISTDDADYIIDVFPLWNEMQKLNEIFTSPSILKIFHSSQSDIIWLQRDLGLYVVNMFDTWVAATTLSYRHVSLSALVNKFCNFQLDKRFQLADWRLRPLTPQMLQYARCDTHFLLYIYRKLKLELLSLSDQTYNLLRFVMERSQQLCLKRHEKKIPTENDFTHLVWKNNLRFNQRQMTALKSLYLWRDMLARQQDESTGYVLPNNLLLKICEILPREQQGVLACCNPMPPLVQQYIQEIHELILNARSRIVTDHQTEFQKVFHQETNMIDLTNDSLIDHDHHIGKSIKTSDQNDYEDHDLPIYEWNKESDRFDFISDRITSYGSQASKSTLCSPSSAQHDTPMIDFLIKLSNRNKKLQKSKNNNQKSITDDFQTFYQRYLKQIEPSSD